MCDLCGLVYSIFFKSYPSGRPFYYQSEGTRIINHNKSEQIHENNKC